MAFSHSSLHFPLNSLPTTIIILSAFLFFLITPSFPPKPDSQSSQLIPHRSLFDTSSNRSCSSIIEIPPRNRCSFSLLHCKPDSNGLINYFSIHFCIFQENPFLSVPILSLSILLQFYILVKTAQDRFSVVVTKLCAHLSLSPSMGAVTLLALGNGAPDVFASLAAVRGGQPRTGFGAILSAGAFVSALVVGFVGIYTAPFGVDPGPFVRDVMFYLIAALFLFYVYLSGEIYVWQAIGFVGYYFLFVGFVFWMDIGSNKAAAAGRGGRVAVGDVELQQKMMSRDSDHSNGLVVAPLDGRKTRSRCCGAIEKVSMAWEVPVSILLKLTIPQSSPSEWSRFYQSANIVLCPLALLYSCKSFVPMSHPVLFLIPNLHFPLWLVMLLSSSSLAVVHYVVEKEPPRIEQVPVVIVAFVMSVFWISTVAGELLNCLAALGELLKLPPALLGLTVLAWGNSVGDLVADVALARAGQPALAMAGCFAGPMFNMLVGLGAALVIQTSQVFPEAYELHFHISIVVAFVFLLLSLMGSLLVIAWCRFRVPRFWGFCLVGLYAFFMAVSLIIAKFSS
ncbi:Cation/calcium exchanger 5 [Dionaea muscipula]